MYHSSHFWHGHLFSTYASRLSNIVTDWNWFLEIKLYTHRLLDHFFCMYKTWFSPRIHIKSCRYNCFWFIVFLFLIFVFCVFIFPHPSPRLLRRPPLPRFVSSHGWNTDVRNQAIHPTIASFSISISSHPMSSVRPYVHVMLVSVGTNPHSCHRIHLMLLTIIRVRGSIHTVPV